MSMEARLIRTAALAALLMVSMGARYQSANFIIETSDARFAQQMGQAAEKYRHDLALEWLGKAMPNWSQPCVMTVQVGPKLGAGGATTFVFDRGEVFGWRMNIQGSAERLLDSVLPHEVTHMIFASHFRRPVPRWADEGGATTVECAAEKTKHRAMLNEFLRTNRGIAFSRLFTMTEYPRDVMPLYAQGYSLAEYLIQHGGRQKYIKFLDDGMSTNQWSAAIQRHYNLGDLGALQNTWLAWVAQGSPAAKPSESAVVAAGGAAPSVTAASVAVPAASGTVTQASATAPLEQSAAIRPPRPEPNLLLHVPNDQANQTVAVQSPGEPTAVPAGGWRPVGAAPPPPAADPPDPAPYRPGSTKVAPPQVMEASPRIQLQ